MYKLWFKLLNDLLHMDLKSLSDHLKKLPENKKNIH